MTLILYVLLFLYVLLPSVGSTSPSPAPSHARSTKNFISLVGGTGTASSAGTGGKATAASFNTPRGVWIDSMGTLFASELTCVRKFSLSNPIVVAVWGVCGTVSSVGDNMPATSATVAFSIAGVTDTTGKFFGTDYSANVIKVVNTGGIVSTLAGISGTSTTTGDGGPSTSSTIKGPNGMWINSQGELFFASYTGNVVRKIATSSNIITAYAGTGASGTLGLGGKATSAQLNSVEKVHTDTAGNVYLSDAGNMLIKVVNSGNIISSLVGSGTSGYAGENTAATSTQISYPTGMTSDSSNGDIYYADRALNRVRVFSRVSGLVSTVSGSGTAGTAGDGGYATAATVNTDQLFTDTHGNLYLAEWTGHKYRTIYSVEPTIAPSVIPTIVPTALPTVIPTITPTVVPTISPTVLPTVVPTVMPTVSPSVLPSIAPTVVPTIVPSVIPSVSPSIAPSTHPTMTPSVVPTLSPTVSPSFAPSVTPSAEPTIIPSTYPSMTPTFQPTLMPSTMPTALPSVVPSVIPSIAPSLTPSTQPSVTPSVVPSVVPSVEPSITPTALPSIVPSVVPSLSPSVSPSNEPSPLPSQLPSTAPSEPPTSDPTEAPTIEPSLLPSVVPTFLPTVCPTATPTVKPSVLPSIKPSVVPTALPSVKPSVVPSISPTLCPTVKPSIQSSPLPSIGPSRSPSAIPTRSPSLSPSVKPTIAPSMYPSMSPTLLPFSLTRFPTPTPSLNPSVIPTVLPSIGPTFVPSFSPSVLPTRIPSIHPSVIPSVTPSFTPTYTVTITPSIQPSPKPSVLPSVLPSVGPSATPTILPSELPSVLPTVTPTLLPSFDPSVLPSTVPSISPTIQPSMIPTATPSLTPTLRPTVKPTTFFPSISLLPSTIKPSVTPTVRPSAIPTIVPNTNPVIPPTVSPSFSPTVYVPIATLPGSESISVIGLSHNESFQIILPFQDHGTYSNDDETSTAFSDVVVSFDDSFGLSHVLMGRSGLGSSVGGVIDVNANVYGQMFSFGSSFVVDSGGRSMSILKDFNGDGYDDLIIGDPLRARCYVLFGTFNGFTNMTQGFTIFGENNFDLTGWSVSSAGDVNNDNLNDIIIGAPQFSRNGSAIGAVYVIYGKAAGTQLFDVYLSRLTPSDGFAAYGVDQSDYVGVSVSDAGDVNGDGYDDVVVGAALLNSYNGGAAYVIFGKALFTSALALSSSLLTALNAGMSVNGNAFEFVGYSVSGVGDVNRDGYDDVLIGGFNSKLSHGGLSASKSILLFGSNLMNTTNVKTIQLIGGNIVTGVGDINSDGFYDLMLSSVNQSSYRSTENKLSGLLLKSSIAFASFPSVAPSNAPTVVPTRFVSASPTIARTTIIPSKKPTATPTTLCPSQSPSMSPTRPTAVPNAGTSTPSVDPSAAPFLPTSLPSRMPVSPSIEPSLTPSEVPTVYPSVEPSEPPTETPTAEPSSLSPSLLPTIPYRPVQTRPTASPSVMPTLHSLGSYEVIDMSQTSSSSAQYFRTNDNLNFIVNCSVNVTIAAGSLGGRDKFTIIPNANTKLTIEHFNVSSDVIDLTHFTAITAFKSLVITAGSAIIHLPDNQLVRIVNLTPSDLSAHHLILYVKPSVESNADAGVSKLKLIQSFLIAISVVLTAIAAIYFYIIRPYARKRIREAKLEHIVKALKEKYTFNIKELARLAVLEASDEISGEQQSLSSFGSEESEDNHNGEQKPKWTTEQIQHRMLGKPQPSANSQLHLPSDDWEAQDKQVEPLPQQINQEAYSNYGYLDFGENLEGYEFTVDNYSAQDYYSSYYYEQGSGVEITSARNSPGSVLSSFEVSAEDEDDEEA